MYTASESRRRERRWWSSGSRRWRRTRRRARGPRRRRGGGRGERRVRGNETNRPATFTGVAENGRGTQANALGPYRFSGLRSRTLALAVPPSSSSTGGGGGGERGEGILPARSRHEAYPERAHRGALDSFSLGRVARAVVSVSATRLRRRSSRVTDDDFIANLPFRFARPFRRR